MSGSCGFENPKYNDRAAELPQAPPIGGDRLPMEGPDAQETSELIDGAAKSFRGGGTLDSPHRSVSILDPAVLFEPVVQVVVRPIPDRLARFAADRCQAEYQRRELRTSPIDDAQENAGPSARHMSRFDHGRLIGM